MISDTIKSTKTLRDSDDIVKDLLKLRDELYDRYYKGVDGREIFFKINSCLYSGYPEKLK